MKTKILLAPFMALLLSFGFTGCFSAHHNDRYYHNRERDRYYNAKEYKHRHHRYDKDRDKDRDRDRDRGDYGYRRN